jgi:Ser/Thr protein kinase RdoA (MazF antagonist)
MLFIPRPGKLRHVIAAKTRSSQIKEIDIRNVLGAYDLGELEGYDRPATGSGRSQSLIIRTSRGKKALKRYKYSLNLEAITYEHSVLRQLETAGFCAPRLILNRNRETCTELEGSYYAVTDFIPGFKYVDFVISRRKKNEFIAEAARALAHYHRLIDGFVPEGKKTDGFMPDGYIRWQESDWYLREFDKYESLLKDREPNGTPLEHFFLRNMGRFRQGLVDLSRKFEENGRFLPQLVNHGDYGPYNILFDRGRVAAVLDFECTHLDWRACEVIGALYRFSGTKNGIDYDQAKTFLAAYRSSGALAADEVASMPDIFRFSRLRGLTISLRDYFALGVSARLRGARQVVWWVDWMEKEGDRLTKELMSGI